MTIMVAFEGDTDLPVIRRLLEDANLPLGHPLDCGGKARLDAELGGYNGAAKGSPWFVLRDLDDDAPCAGKFLAALQFKPSRWMCFRLAVRELEAWLLADREAVSQFFRVDDRHIPVNPDIEPDPTATPVALARKSTSSAVRRAMVPARGRGGQVGPLYEATIIEFGEKAWQLERASQTSPSLQRAREALRVLARRWRAHVGRGRSP
jgi:hypothetical protein